MTDPIEKLLASTTFELSDLRKLLKGYSPQLLSVSWDLFDAEDSRTRLT